MAKELKNVLTLGESGILPTEASALIYKKAADDSVILKAAGTTPMAMSGNQFITPVGEVVAGVVGEGAMKPTANVGSTAKSVKPIKVATIIPWSKEHRIADEYGVTQHFINEAAKAIRRAIDVAIIHGKDGLTGNTIPGVEYLTQSKNKIQLGTAAVKDGGLTADILDGYDKVVDADFDFDAFVAAPQVRTKLGRAFDANGRPLYDNINLADSGPSSILGLPTYFGQTVAGRYGAVADTGVRMIGGNFENNLRFGFVDGITYDRSKDATITDADGNLVSLWVNNLEAIRVEAIFGWIIGDVDGFAVYTDKPAGSGA